MRVNKKSEKVGLKYSFKKNQYHSIWPHHFMTNRWKTVKTVKDFIFLGSKTTVGGD